VVVDSDSLLVDLPAEPVDFVVVYSLNYFELLQHLVIVLLGLTPRLHLIDLEEVAYLLVVTEVVALVVAEIVALVVTEVVALVDLVD